MPRPGDRPPSPYTALVREAPPHVLAIDTASPTVSVAVAAEGRLRGERSIEIARSSERLLAMVEEVLAEAGLAAPGELAGVVALGGPGSFTGLRVGLATVLGFHQAVGLPATAVPTHLALALAAPPEAGGRLLAAVDVLRDEWAVQELVAGSDGPEPLAPPERVPTATLLERVAGGPAVIGFGVSALADRAGAAADRLLEPPPLAAAVACHATLHPPAWDPALLTRPLYFRPPAVTLPRRR